MTEPNECGCHDCAPELHVACTNKPYCCDNCYPIPGCPARAKRKREAEDKKLGTSYQRLVRFLAKLCQI